MTEAEAVESVRKLVHYFAKKWRHYATSGRLDYEDIIQAGLQGAVKAWRKFDPSQNPHFPTYAAFWIKAYIAQECLELGRTVRVPIRVLRSQRQSGELVAMHCRNVEDYTHELISPEPMQRNHDREAAVAHALGSLTWRERKAIKMRFSDQEPTLNQIGKALGGVSRERARQIIAKALAKLKQKSPELKDLL